MPATKSVCEDECERQTCDGFDDRGAAQGHCKDADEHDEDQDAHSRGQMAIDCRTSSPSTRKGATTQR